MRTIDIEPNISFHATKKAFFAMGFVYKFYFKLHGLTEEDLFKFFPTLIFVEGVIYQADEENEMGKKAEFRRRWDFVSKFLKEHNLLDDKLKEELEAGRAYYELERKMLSGRTFTEEEIIATVRQKCYDFRVLHRLIYKLMGKPYDDLLFEVFKEIEVLMELEGDINDYAKDIANNAFNTYRMYVRLYGKDGKKRIEEFWERQMQAVRAKIAKLPAEMQTVFDTLEKEYRKIAPIPPIPEPIIEKKK